MRFYYFLILLILGSTNATAQRVFAEGTIKYDVSIDPPANQEGLVQYKGSYTIITKGPFVKETLTLENGYATTLLYNYRDSTVYSLKKLGNKNYAIQLDLKSMQNRRKKYEGYTLNPLKTTKEIDGIVANEAIVTYKNGNTSTIAYNNSTAPGHIVFDNYPGIQYLLLLFTNYNDDGTAIHFSAKKIDEEPVENAVFRIPSNYKIISNAEYLQFTGGR
ncbi:MAG TPA: hypothetical protein VK167_03450 [Flavipsychrobacter sp.]|nr:hypothetical protein [Flavipsychrobacter sp.]